MKIGKKLILMHMIIALLSTSALAGIILNLSQKQIQSLVSREMENLAEREAREIQIWLEIYLDAARTAGQIMEQYEQIKSEGRREYFSLLTKSIVTANPEVIAAWTCWEPDALDGMDAKYAGSPGTDHTGRFIPYWYKSGNGIVLQALKNYDIPGQGDYAMKPLETGHETLSEPYRYPVNGEERLIVSLAYPVKRNGIPVAAFGVDVALDTIQARVNGIRPYPGSVAAVYSNSGFIAAHFDDSRFGQYMQDGPVLGTRENYIFLRQAVNSGTPLVFTDTIPNLGGEMIFTCVPFTAGKSVTPWTLMIGIPGGIVTSPIKQMLIIGIGIALASFLILSIAALIMARSISKPIKLMADIFRIIHTENPKEFKNSALLQQLPAELGKRRDEIGEFTMSLVSTAGSIRKLINNIDSATQSIRQGRIMSRLDTESFGGNYLRIVKRMNMALDLICSQLDMAPEALSLFNEKQEMVYRNRAMDLFLQKNRIEGADNVLKRIIPQDSDTEKRIAAFFDPRNSESDVFTIDIDLPGTKTAEPADYSLSLMRSGGVSRSGEESPLCVMMLLRDTTVLTRARIAAEVASRAKGDFLSRMSHEIRTPLNAITGMTRIAMESDDLEKIRNCLRQVDSSSSHLLGVINDILDFSKIEAGKLSIEPEEFSLSDDLEFVSSMLQARTRERQISLTVQVENLVNNLVFTDPLRLNQVMINLLSNAVKFSPKESEVKLVVREEGSSNGISTFRFEVIDRGIGISEQQAEKLFRPFEQSDGSITRNYGGTGLGLAISKNLVEMMGGVVGLESKINCGSTFWFTIVCPARTGQGKAKAEDTHDEETRITAASLDFSGKRCLVVDDVDINREIILELLGDTRLEMETAANGKEALEMFTRSNEGYYDLILMDMQMPVLDGCSASVEIRKLDRSDAAKVPIIAMTANVLQEDIRRVLDAGMNAHLGKPIDMQAMFTILREYLGTNS